MAERGKYIVFEGGEYVGKTTQAHILAEDIGAIVVRQTGGTKLGEHIRSLIADQTIPTTPVAELFLHTAQRPQLVAEVLEPNLSSGVHIISDRSWVSGAAYQGAQGINFSDIEVLNKIALGEYLNPDLLIVLDANPQEVKNRSVAPEDYYEQMEEEFHNQVRANYLNLSKKLGGVAVDATPSIEQVSQEIRKIVRERLHI